MTRIVILGGPKTGKTTLAGKLARGAVPFEPAPKGPPYCDPGSSDAPVKHTDDLIHLGWSEASQAAALWFNEPGPWIIEGVAVVRALRKWRDQHPGERPPVDRVIRLTTPHVALTPGQAAMAKGEETVWQEIADWLFVSGVPLVERAELRCEHPGYNGTAVIG